MKTTSNTFTNSFKANAWRNIANIKNSYRAIATSVSFYNDKSMFGVFEEDRGY